MLIRTAVKLHDIYVDSHTVDTALLPGSRLSDTNDGSQCDHDYGTSSRRPCEEKVKQMPLKMVIYCFCQFD